MEEGLAARFNLAFKVYKENAKFPSLNNLSHSIVFFFVVVLFEGVVGLNAEVCSIGSYTYRSRRRLTKRAGPKVMIIYEYQYEKECELKKMHCY